jgi:hypothetical protein
LLRLPEPSCRETAFLNLHYSLPRENDKLWIVGRGGTDENEPYSRVPMEAQADFVSRDEGELEYNDFINPDLQFARSQGLSDTCYADAGGPIFIRPTDKDVRDLSEDILVGVTNWGDDEGCQASTQPYYYNRVASALSWVISIAPEILEAFVTESM